MNILITGGAGFIGTNTSLFFGGASDSHITIVDNLSRVGTDKNLSFLKKKLGKKLTFIQSDINDTNNYKHKLKRADVVIHLAGQTAVTTSILAPHADFTTNVVGGFTLLELVRTLNPKAIVLYASTNKVYGDLAHHAVTLLKSKKQYINTTCPKGVDETERLHFISPYGCSKGAVDQYVLDYAHSFGIRAVVFRQSCIYGPHQLGVEDQGWVAHFSKQFILNRPITIFGDGYQVRDLLHVDDLIHLYDRAIQSIHTVTGQALNAGGGIINAYSLHQVLELLKTKVGSSPQITYMAERVGDQKYFVSNNTKAKKLLGWRPNISFTSGVESLITWQKENLT